MKHKQWQASDKTVPEPFSVAVLKQRIRATLADGNFLNWDQFEEVAMGYGVDAELRGEGGRGITYRMMRDDGTGRDEWLEEGSVGDRRRASKLGTEFMMDAVERAIQQNARQRALLLNGVRQPSVPPRAAPSRVAVLLQGILDDSGDEAVASMQAPGEQRGDGEDHGPVQLPMRVSCPDRRNSESPEETELAPASSEAPAPTGYEQHRQQLTQRLAAKGLREELDSHGPEFGWN
ncbi:hypothetical protein [Nesterenkonia lutea]|uniref:Uncharacterized protein n=1 Tax=Nesterenkonia lutea TaxID=272919 RepID=A0ABR9JBC2_9MICC|nr:hypothetical protein [Nesterenkonia lutea]MBE1523234.1 hypothetical protein [Nesterenkonia lutea]